MRLRLTTAITLSAGLACCASAQDIFWNAGPGVWHAVGNWSPLNIPDAASENAIIGVGGPVTMQSNASINSLVLGSGRWLFIEPSSTLSLAGDLINEGLLTLHSSTGAGNSLIYFGASDPVISGSGGVIRLSGGTGSDAQISAASGTVVTNEAGHTIDGAGYLNASMVNNGVITALDMGSEGDTIFLQSASKTNNSTIQASSGAVVSLNGITLTQGPSGVLAASGGGLISFDGSQTVQGGRIVRVTTGGVTRQPNGTTVLVDVEIDADIEACENSTISYTGSTFDLTGLLTLNDTSSVSNSTAYFTGDCLLTGGGTIFLAGSGDDSQVNAASGKVLTIDPGFTIEGSGSINASVVNNGMVRAFPSANGNGALFLQSTNKSNNTLMVADPGGLLQITGITITQDPAAQLLADGGEIRLEGNQTIRNGTFRAINGGTITRPPNAVTTLENVVLDADLHVRENCTLSYRGPVFQMMGTLTLNDTASVSNSALYFNDDCLLTGGATVFLAGSSNDSQINAASGRIVTLDSGTVVEGSGEINASIVNNGLVVAVPSTFGNGSIVLQSTNKVNNTQMIAMTDGVLQVSGISVTQAPGAELLAEGGLIDLSNNQTIVGGTIRTANGGSILRRANATTVLNNVVVVGDLPVESNATINYQGSVFDMTGTLTLNESGSTSNSNLYFSDNCEILGGATVFLAGGGDDSQLNAASGRTVTLASGAEIVGSGVINASIVNNGSVRAYATEFGNGRITLQSTNKINNTRITAEPGGVLAIPGITVTQGAGAELLIDGGTLDLTNNQTIVGGSIRAINGGQVLRAANAITSLVNVEVDADIDLAANAQIQYTGETFRMNGTLVVNETGSTSNSSLYLADSCELTGDMTIFLAGGGDDSQINAASGRTVTLTDTVEVVGSGTINAMFVNDGLIRAAPSAFGDGRIVLQSTNKTNNTRILADPGGSIVVSAITLSQGPDGEVLLDGGTLDLSNNQTITGGTIRAINGGQALKPANSTLTLNDVAVLSDLSVGANSTVFYNGVEFVGSGTVSINDSASTSNSFFRFSDNCLYSGGGTLFLGGGGNDSQITTNGGKTLTVGPMNIIGGEGELNGTFVVEGTVAPGLPFGSIGGTTGSVAFTPSALLAVEAEGPSSSGSINRAGGSVALNGTLRVTPVNDYVPVQGEIITVVTAPSVVGQWGTIELGGPLPRGLAARGIYTSTSAGIEFLNCPADIASPFGGVLDIDDVLLFLNSFASGDPLADYVVPFGELNIDDVLFFLNSFAAGCD